MKLNSIDFSKIDKNHKLRTAAMHFFSFLPDETYIKFLYKVRTGKKLNLKDPVGFNEKLNWLKLNDKHPEYGKLVDKIAVREVIEEKLGPGHTFPLLGVWDRFENINFDKLPDKFVLKCNHDSGSYKIIEDKNSLTEKEIKNLKKHFNKHVKGNPFFATREYPYKYVKGKIFAEEFIESPNKSGINDYKFFCFDGVPQLLLVAVDRQKDVKFDFYDMQWNHLNIVKTHPQSGVIIEKPSRFEEMGKVAAELSQGMKFVRIDLYEVDDKIYFGEYTFFPGGGLVLFTPEEWEKKLGDMLKL